MKMKTLAIIAAFAFSSATFTATAALKPIPVTDSAAFTLDISRVHPNHLVVKGDRFAAISVNDGLLTYDVNKVTGDLTFSVTEDGMLENSIQGFLTTEQGHSYQFSFVPKEINSVNSVLIPDGANNKPLNPSAMSSPLGAAGGMSVSMDNQGSSDVQTTLSMLAAMKSGSPSSCEMKTVDLAVKTALPPAFSVKMTQVCIGETLVGEKLIATNNSALNQTVTERLMNATYGQAVAFDLPSRDMKGEDIVINPHQTFTIYRFRRND